MKKFKYYFLRSLPIILIVLIIVTFAMIADMQEKVDDMYEYNEDEEVNTVVTNKDNGTVTDTVENEVTNEVTNEVFNETKNEVVSNVTVIEKSPDTMSNEDREQIVTTDNKQKAVDLVKAKYGTGMNYFCDSVLASGEFVVAARMQGSSTVSAYYKVNIETGKITLMY